MNGTAKVLPYYHADNDCPHGYAQVSKCPRCTPPVPYITITATALQPGHILLDTAANVLDTVTSTETTANGYVLFNSERYPNVPRMARAHSQWRVTVNSHSRVLAGECIHPGVFAAGPVPGTEHCYTCDTDVPRQQL